MNTMDDADNISYVFLGVVQNADDSFVHLREHEPRVAFVKDYGEFIECD